MLLREHFGRREQRGLAARVHHLEHGADSDDGLARADLALQQPVHRIGAGQVVGDHLAHLLLPRSERERQAAVEGRGDPVGDLRPRHRGHRRRGVPPLSERDLHGERLVPLEPPARVPQVLPVLRPVYRPDRQLTRP
jgi:hypothetical protein